MDTARSAEIHVRSMILQHFAHVEVRRALAHDQLMIGLQEALLAHPWLQRSFDSLSVSVLYGNHCIICGCKGQQNFTMQSLP